MTGPNFSLFILCALIAIIGAVITVLSKRPLRAAMGLLAHIISLAGLYLTLSAHMLAAIQLLVYAGAIVVLFVFVIMLIGPRSESLERAPTAVGARVASVALMVMITGGLAFSLVHLGKTWVGAPEGFGTVASVGMTLFTDTLVPFEIVSVTLTVAVIAAIALAKNATPKELAQAREVRDAVKRQREEESAAAAAK